MRIKLCGLIACAAMLAAGVVSCQQHDDIPQGVKYPILFDSPDTRATATIDDLKKGFMVYAFVEGNAGSTSFAKEVTHSVVEGRDIWALETPEYWLPDTDYYFKAFYPSELSAGTLTVYNTDKNQNFTIEGYDITKQEDVMVAEATASVGADASAPTAGSVVPLKFDHLLANIVVKIKAEVNVTINNVSFKYAPVNGSYTNGLWSYSSQGNIEKVGLDKTLSSSSNEYHDVTDGGFLVFPSSVSGTSLFIRTSDKTYELPLQAPDSWVAGNRYTYTLTIKQNDILFDEPTVEEWDEENAVGSVIIK